MALLLAAVDPGDPVTGALVSYGVAAPLVYFAMKARSDAVKERDAERHRNEKLTDQLIAQQAQVIPVLVEATTAIKAIGK